MLEEHREAVASGKRLVAVCLWDFSLHDGWVYRIYLLKMVPSAEGSSAVRSA